jgi:hypothetical protein
MSYAKEKAKFDEEVEQHGAKVFIDRYCLLGIAMHRFPYWHQRSFPDQLTVEATGIAAAMSMASARVQPPLYLL